MKIKFDANQDYQLSAIRSVVEVFRGQQRGSVARSVALSSAEDLFEVAGVPNVLTVAPETLLENVREIQAGNELKQSDALEAMTFKPEEAHDDVALNFSLEMETGTGKTYVYLRTIYELHREYGFKKFIITVPSVAIREGVLYSLRQTEEHFRALYGSIPVDAWIYDSKQVSRLRQFATSQDVQILIINISAFDKDTNVLYQENDALSGLAPIEFIQAVNPIVIVDEPQNFEGEQARKALSKLHPLCVLRYSATLKSTFNLLYKLGPVKAYDLKLVKQIEVLSVLEQENFNVPYLCLKEVKPTRSTVTAKLELDVWGATKDGGSAKRKSIAVKHGDDLLEKSGGREIYSGYVIDEINAEGFVSFSNGQRAELNQVMGDNADDLMRVQVRETVREHLNRELNFSRLPVGERMKVLSLFFIDRVANYRGEDAKIRRWFEEAYLELSQLPAYKPLNSPPLDSVHDGYFAQDKAGASKDTNGRTQADDDAYEKIMRDKERLLSLEEPLRYIFSHSALREGWDNPNVFQICTLNESRSEVKKRQEIGRGLRLPVRENGERSRDPNLNRLIVVANESYKEFADSLQKEIQHDTGETFGTDRVKNTRDRRKLQLVKGWELNEDFRELWGRIKHHTRYRVEFDSAAFVERAAKALSEMHLIQPPAYRVERGRIVRLGEGMETVLAGVRSSELGAYKPFIPDLLAHLQRETELTRGTLTRILQASGRLEDASKNPQQFLDLTLATLKNTLQEVMVDGIKYEKLEGQEYDMMLFESKELESYLTNILEVNHSIYNGIVFQSGIESEFARVLDGRDDVKLFVKLPDWFEVDTPLGKYRPDWAVVMVDDGLERLYFICETKSTLDKSKRRTSENLKIECGMRHFEAIDVPYVVEVSASNLTSQKVRTAGLEKHES